MSTLVEGVLIVTTSEYRAGDSDRSSDSRSRHHPMTG
jgi:hypothetical protein